MNNNLNVLINESAEIKIHVLNEHELNFFANFKMLYNLISSDKARRRRLELPSVRL